MTPLTKPLYVFDQAQWEGCTGCALAGAMMAQRAMDGRPQVLLSAGMVWSEELVVTGQLGRNVGIVPEVGLKVLQTYGIAPLADEPTMSDVAPPAQALRDALRYRIATWKLLDGSVDVWPYPTTATNQTLLASVKSALASNKAVVLAVNCAVWGLTGSDGVLPVPTPDHMGDAGHLVFVQHDDTANERVDGVNSWGVSFGDGGMFRMPYAWVLTPALVQAAWTIDLAAEPGTQTEVTPVATQEILVNGKSIGQGREINPGEVWAPVRLLAEGLGATVQHATKADGTGEVLITLPKAP